MKRCYSLGMTPIALENSSKSDCFNKMIGRVTKTI
jgi:hypothetical protein